MWENLEERREIKKVCHLSPFEPPDDTLSDRGLPVYFRDCVSSYLVSPLLVLGKNSFLDHFADILSVGSLCVIVESLREGSLYLIKSIVVFFIVQ